MSIKWRCECCAESVNDDGKVCSGSVHVAEHESDVILALQRSSSGQVCLLQTHHIACLLGSAKHLCNAANSLSSNQLPSQREVHSSITMVTRGVLVCVRMCVYAWVRVLLDCPQAVLASWCMLLGITSPPLLALYVCTQWGCAGVM